MERVRVQDICTNKRCFINGTDGMTVRTTTVDAWRVKNAGGDIDKLCRGRLLQS